MRGFLAGAAALTVFCFLITMSHSAAQESMRAGSDVGYSAGAGPILPVDQVRARFPRAAHHVRRHGEPGIRISDLISALHAKVSEILSGCHGTRLISGYRPGARVLGSGHPSLHSVYPARAADLSGSPSCIYGHLAGWPGGYSTDYARVRHVHVSYSPPGTGYLAGREWHARFVHYGSHHRYASHRRVAHRYLATR